MSSKFVTMRYPAFTRCCSNDFSTNGSAWCLLMENFIGVWKPFSFEWNDQYRKLQNMDSRAIKHYSRNISPLSNKIVCDMGLQQLLFLVLIFGIITANRTLNVLGYCIKISANLANFHSSSIATKIMSFINIFYAYRKTSTSITTKLTTIFYTW